MAAREPAPGRRRGVRSYVLRQGRITRAQRRALDELLPRYGVETDSKPFDLDSLFGRRAPRTIEIGFGNGDCLVALAETNPDRDYLGIEVHRPGIGHLLLALERKGLDNVRVVAGDAVEALKHLPPSSIDGLNIFFPDPWPKKRHHKRRLVQPAFLALAAHVLRPGASLELATDWEEYAEQMLATCDESPYFDNAVAGGGYADGPRSRLPSRFERRSERLGHRVRDLLFERTAKAASDA